MTTKVKSLDLFPNNISGKIHGFCSDKPALISKLREIGFAEGDEIEIRHRGLFGGTPISVRLNRSLIALRKSEAAHILVVADQ